MLLPFPVKVPVEVFIVCWAKFVAGEAFGFQLVGLCPFRFRPDATVRKFALGLRQSLASFITKGRVTNGGTTEGL